MSLAAAAPTSFIFTRDRARAKAFYGDTLGLSQSAEDQFGVVYDLCGSQMRLTDIADHVAGPHTVLGWTVHDLSSAMADLRAKGVEFLVYDGFGQDADGIWTAPDGHARIAWFNDPDGNNLSIMQRG